MVSPEVGPTCKAFRLVFTLYVHFWADEIAIFRTFALAYVYTLPYTRLVWLAGSGGLSGRFGAADRLSQTPYFRNGSDLFGFSDFSPADQLQPSKHQACETQGLL